MCLISLSLSPRHLGVKLIWVVLCVRLSAACGRRGGGAGGWRGGWELWKFLQQMEFLINTMPLNARAPLLIGDQSRRIARLI